MNFKRILKALGFAAAIFLCMFISWGLLSFLFIAGTWWVLPLILFIWIYATLSDTNDG